MLSVQNLQVRYGEIEVVHGIDLDVAAGEIVALVGANGAGKSTTLAAICGLLRPSSGRITFDGNDVTAQPAEEISRRGMALVPEGRRVFAQLTVAENLLLGGAAHLGATLRERQEELLGRFAILRSRYRS